MSIRSIVNVNDVIYRGSNSFIGKLFGGAYYGTKDGQYVCERAAEVVDRFKRAQHQLKSLTTLIEAVSNDISFIYLRTAIANIALNQTDNPIFEKLNQLERILKECSIRTTYEDKLSRALEVCTELEELLNPEVDRLDGRYIFVSKGKQRVDIDISGVT